MTRLLGEPFAQLLFSFLLRNGSVLARVVETLPNFFENIEMILNVLQAAVLRKLVEQRLDLLFRGGHRAARIAWPLQIKAVGLCGLPIATLKLCASQKRC